MAKKYFFLKNVVAWHLQKGLGARKKIYVTKETGGIYHTKKFHGSFFLYISFTGNSRTSLGKIIS